MRKKIISIILCFILTIAVLPVNSLAASRDVSFENGLAADLKGLNLFQGISGTDFDLSRSPTRTEALVMLIRILGKETEALTGTWTHPFTDVPSWANQYIGYAYEAGLTTGVSDTLFGDSAASASMYLTFVLRALGYSDAGGADFTWDNPYHLAKSTGILPDGVNTNTFWRADLVMISYAALAVAEKGSSRTLAQSLMADGVFTSAQYYQYYDIQAFSNRAAEKTVLDARDIYAACSPAVFCINTYDANGAPYALGSGFFIEESGIAVTNYHVLENALTATAILTNGREYDILGVLLFNEELDYAVIKVAGSGFTALTVGDSSAVVGGETVYAIGSPQGLTSTISDGIVANPCRTDLDGMIQITAPISKGSSGGALINAYGEVIGVTTASITTGQNLNFAVPINDVMPEEDISEYERLHGFYTMREYFEINR